MTRPCWSLLRAGWVLAHGCEGAPPRPGTPPRREVRPRLLKRGPEAWAHAGAREAGPLRKVGTSRPLVHAVSDEACQSYSPLVRALFYDARLRQAPLENAKQIDIEPCRYMDDICYVQNARLPAAQKTFAGLTHLAPELKPHLPRPARALTSRQQLHNAAEGGPVPEEGSALSVQSMLRHGRRPSAIVALASYDELMREADWERITGRDVAVVPSPRGPPQVALLLSAGARNLATKRGSDQGVAIECRTLCYILTMLKETTDDSAPLFPIDQIGLLQHWWAALDDTGITDHWPPHSLRHSGPSHKALGGVGLDAIRRRGRWASLKSVQRCTEPHVLLACLARLGAERMTAGKTILNNLPSCFWTRRCLDARPLSPNPCAAERARRRRLSSRMTGKGPAQQPLGRGFLPSVDKVGFSFQCEGAIHGAHAAVLSPIPARPDLPDVPYGMFGLWC
jgi:hypothetical protein